MGFGEELPVIVGCEITDARAFVHWLARLSFTPGSPPFVNSTPQFNQVFGSGRYVAPHSGSPASRSP
jgi:hypothetical protein